MNTRSFSRCIALLLLFAGILAGHADITVRLSVKFILNTNGAYPVIGPGTNTGIGTNGGFQFEVDRGNGVLAATGRGYKLQVVEYLPIQPPPPAGQPANYYFTNNARSNRAAWEAASIADPVAWRRNVNGALNIYVNRSSSGQCSFIGSGDSISLGTSIGTGTVLHEIGHFFNLSHTHSGDATCTNPPPYALADGDGLSETVPDHNCYTNRAALMAALPIELQPLVDTSWLNVMSYHQEDQLLDIQMDYWTHGANHARNTVCSGYTWFVATDGADSILINDGLGTGQAFQTVAWTLQFVSTPDDILLLKSGTYLSPATLSTPCTLRATRGPVTLTR